MGWAVNVTPRPLYLRKETRYPFYNNLCGDARPVWTGAENFALTGIRCPDHPARSKSLYGLRYRGSLCDSIPDFFNIPFTFSSSKFSLPFVFSDKSFLWTFSLSYACYVFHRAVLYLVMKMCGERCEWWCSYMRNFPRPTIILPFPCANIQFSDTLTVLTPKFRSST